MVVGEDLIVELRAGGYGRDGSVGVFKAIPEFQRAHDVVVAIRHICNFFRTVGECTPKRILFYGGNG